MDRFRLMETYIAVAKHGSYTRAARDLGLTRAMVSKRIADLEARLGLRLLNRNAHRVSTTAAGADYLQNCTAVLDHLAEVEDRLLDQHAAPRGDLKILASKTLGDTVLAPITAEFCRAYPDISLRLILRDMAPHGMDLISEGFDIAVRTRPVSDSSLLAKPIVRLRRLLVASPDYLARHGAPATPADLVTRNCLNPNDSRRASWTFKTAHGPVTVAVTGDLLANSSAVIRQAALKGLGVAALSEFVVAGDLARGDLVRVLPEFAVDERMLHVIYQRDRHRPYRVKVFVDYLTEHLEAFSWTGAISRRAG